MWIIWLEKKILQTLGFILGVMLVLLTALHFFIVNNAEKLLEDLVELRSNNKVKLHIRNLKFNYFSKKIELESVLFYSIDSTEKNATYRLSVKNIRLKVNAIMPIFTRKELKIDSLYLAYPDIEVIKLKQSDSTANKESGKVSVSEELGRIYNSIMDALQLLQVSRFEFNNGNFSLTDHTIPQQKPLKITNLHFHINNLRLDSTGMKNKMVYSDEMIFRTSDQDILFPDGKHWLGFSQFRIDIKNKTIEIDSCTVKGIKSDSSKARFSVFVDILKLTNFDFTSLYENQLIKADSVYCINPVFNIVLEPETGPVAKKQSHDLDTIIQQLTGDLQLGYVGVRNAGINFTTYKDGVPTSFTSDKNNFEMTRLAIIHHAAKPVTLEGFSMGIRNYENFLKDSTYFLRFDSILLITDKLLLSNISINTQPGVDAKNVRVSRVQFTTLSWPDLLFNRRVKAKEATLYSPVIDYAQAPSAAQKKKPNIFELLGDIDKIMDLERLRIVNGQIKLKPAPETEVLLEDVNVTINTKVLGGSKQLSGIERSVEEVTFSRSVFKLKSLFAELTGAIFSGDNNQLSAQQVRVYNPKQTFNARARRVLLNGVQFDEIANSISANGLYWQSANIEINPPSEQSEIKKQALALHFDDIRGMNTSVGLNKGPLQVTAHIEKISADKLTRENKIEIRNLQVMGKNVSFVDNTSDLETKNFTVSDHQHSFFKNLVFLQANNGNSVSFDMREFSFVPDINSLLDGKIKLQQVSLSEPTATIRTKAKENKETKQQRPFPEIDIDQVEINHPSVHINSFGKKGTSDINWKGNNNLKMVNIKKSKEGDSLLQIEKLTGDLSGFNFINSKGKTVDSKEAEMRFEAENILIKPGNKLWWSAQLNKAETEKIVVDSVGKGNGRLEISTARLQNIFVSTELIKKLPDLIRENPSFSVSGINGSLVDKKKVLRLYNLGYSNANHSASLDSFSFFPTVSRDAFVRADSFQTDYMTFKTGAIKIKGIDPDLYFTDSVFKTAVLHITNPFFTSYRDKRPPFRHGIIKPLPPGLISRIPVKLSIDTIQIAGGNVVYTEMSDKTNEEGIIRVARMSGDIFPIRNYNLTSRDTLRIRINGYLMDSAWIRLRVRESYTDSLQGFLLTVRMRPGSLTYLNPILIPLAQVRLQSGYLDTLQMRAVGHDQLSFGEMRMFYHDLKVQFLKEGSQTKKTFLSGLINFIANSFVINNKNQKKPGVVYFPRTRDRSFINYYIKMTMSGVASSVGAKSTKKMMRKYKKEIKGRRLPPIDYD